MGGGGGFMVSMALSPPNHRGEIVVYVFFAAVDDNDNSDLQTPIHNSLSMAV